MIAAEFGKGCGLLVPAIPSGGGTHVLSLIGAFGGSLTLLSYNHLLRDEGTVDPRNLSAPCASTSQRPTTSPPSSGGP